MLFFKNKKVFVLEGNIGAGKSTFLSILNRHLNITPIYEPHNLWQNVAGQNILDMFYQDTQRWAYTFQTYAFITRVMSQKDFLYTGNDIAILERSVFSDRYCFAKNCYEAGLMTQLEWNLYKNLFDSIVNECATKIDGFIYLQTNPTTCFSRIQKRNRSEEISIKLEYIESLHQKHEDWLIKKKDVQDIICETPVLTLTCDNDFEFDINNQNIQVTKIAEFLQSYYNINVNRKIANHMEL